MKNLLMFLMLSFSLVGFSQKVKLKKGDVLVDDVVWLKYIDCGSVDKTCSLLNLNDEELIFLNWVTLDGVEPISNFNITGDVTYVEVKFLGLKQSFEIQKTQKNIIELLYKSKAVNQDGTLNEEKVAFLVEKYGHEFSEKYNKGATSTIIINNNQEPKKSGFNINIGG